MKRLAILGCLTTLLAGHAHAQDEATRKHVLHELGGPFIVSRPKVQEALKLSDAQQRTLRDAWPEYVSDAKKVIESLPDLAPADREKTMQAHRRKAAETFHGTLKTVLTAEQFGRLEQLERQHDGPAALGRPEVVRELKITQQQLMQFMGVIQDMQAKILPLIQEAQRGGNVQEIRPRVIQIRKEHQAKLESFLNDTQRAQWKALLGPPVDVLED